ncbi:MAG: hypothetical protein ACM3II_13630 [Rhodospirillaceae bacterium]
MSKKQRVPEMREREIPVTSNRELRRHPELLRRERQAPEPPARSAAEQTVETPQEPGILRAKSSGHGKKTADKWNQ